MVKKKYTIKEMSSKSRAKHPFAVLENGRKIRGFDTKKDAQIYQRAMKKIFG